MPTEQPEARSSWPWLMDGILMGRYADKASMELGLLFTCRLGNVDLDRPVGLLQKKEEQGSQTTMEATLMAQQSPQQREQVHPSLPYRLTPGSRRGALNAR